MLCSKVSNSSVLVATVMEKPHPFADDINRRGDVETIEVTIGNRSALAETFRDDSGLDVVEGIRGRSLILGLPMFITGRAGPIFSEGRRWHRPTNQHHGNIGHAVQSELPSQG
jgi:hypothetical protein